MSLTVYRERGRDFLWSGFTFHISCSVNRGDHTSRLGGETQVITRKVKARPTVYIVRRCVLQEDYEKNEIE